MRTQVIVVLVMSALTGCGTQHQTTGLSGGDAAALSGGDAAVAAELRTRLPPNYRQIIVRDIKRWRDFQSHPIREAQISTRATLYRRGFHDDAIVCVRYEIYHNGYNTFAFSFANGSLLDSPEGDRLHDAWLYCQADLVYVPFPEINKDCTKDGMPESSPPPCLAERPVFRD